MTATRVLAALSAAALLWACGSSDGKSEATGGSGGSGAAGGSGGSGGDGGMGGAGGAGGAGGDGGAGGMGGGGGTLPEPDPFPHGACDTPRPADSPFTETADAIANQGSRFTAAGADSKGNSYYVTVLGRVVWRQPDGTFTPLGQFGNGVSQVRGITMVGDTAWVFAGDTFGAGWLLKIVDGAPTPHDPGKSVMGIFRDGQGRAVAQLCTGVDQCGFFFLGDDFSVEETANAPATLGSCTFLKAFEQKGFAARCWNGGEQYFAVGDDAADLQSIAIGEEIDMARWHGRHPEDIWAFEQIESGVYGLSHWDGSDWVMESVERLNGGGIYALAPAEAVVITPEMTWRFDGSCWAQMIPEGVAPPVYDHESAGPVRLGARTLGWLKGTTFTELELP